MHSISAALASPAEIKYNTQSAASNSSPSAPDNLESSPSAFVARRSLCPQSTAATLQTSLSGRVSPLPPLEQQTSTVEILNQKLVAWVNEGENHADKENR